MRSPRYKPSELTEAMRRALPKGDPLRAVESPHAPMDVSQPTKADKRSEKQLQFDCENWLSLRGYVRMTAANAEAVAAPVPSRVLGWYGHLRNTKGDVLLMADLFVVDERMRECLMVELKTHNTYQPGQREMIRAACWRECRSLDQFEGMIEEWEQACCMEKTFQGPRELNRPIENE